jgi:SAM-dependent methyltransferase
MTAGGLDSGFANLSEDAWHAFVADVAQRLSLREGDSVFEVGSGGGAFLYDLWRRGCVVSGVDRSPALVSLAAEVMPGADFAVADALAMPTRPRVDFVLSHGVFLYFPSHEYAGAVIEAMVAKARRAVALMDLPDAALREQAEAARAAAIGGAEAYARRYAGLEHRYYEREWVAERLVAAGLCDVVIVANETRGYGNAPFRFHAFGFVADDTRRPSFTD